MDTVKLAWFDFAQNNSGGSFQHYPEAGIGYYVYIQAPDWASAVSRAEEIGLYFHGVADGYDCSCCGDRWSSYDWGQVGEDNLDEAEPGGWGISSYAHYYDGTIVDLRQAGIPA